MSRRVKQPLEPSEVPYALFRSAAVPALAAAAVCLVVAFLGSGSTAFVGSLIGTGVVVAFYWTDLAVLRIAEKVTPTSTFALFIGEYLIKIVLLASLMFWLSDATAIDTRSLGVTVVVVALVWTVSLAIAATRVRSFVMEGSGSSASPPQP
jgi:hypothetical protein